MCQLHRRLKTTWRDEVSTPKCSTEQVSSCSHSSARSRTLSSLNVLLKEVQIGPKIVQIVTNRRNFIRFDLDDFVTPDFYLQSASWLCIPLAAGQWSCRRPPSRYASSADTKLGLGITGKLGQAQKQLLLPTVPCRCLSLRINKSCCFSPVVSTRLGRL